MDSKIPEQDHSIENMPYGEAKEILKRIKREPRKFLGKTENFKDNKERHFYQRMLRAFLRGWNIFHFGKEWVKVGGVMQEVPKKHEVEYSPKLKDSDIEKQIQMGLHEPGFRTIKRPTKAKDLRLARRQKEEAAFRKQIADFKAKGGKTETQIKKDRKAEQD